MPRLPHEADDPWDPEQLARIGIDAPWHEPEPDCKACRDRGYYDRWSIYKSNHHHRQWHEDDDGPTWVLVDRKTRKPVDPALHDEAEARAHGGSVEWTDAASDDSPYWVPGALVVCELDGEIGGGAVGYVERAPCRACGGGGNEAIRPDLLAIKSPRDPWERRAPALADSSITAARLRGLSVHELVARLDLAVEYDAAGEPTAVDCRTGEVIGDLDALVPWISDHMDRAGEAGCARESAAAPEDREAGRARGWVYEGDEIKIYGKIVTARRAYYRYQPSKPGDGPPWETAERQPERQTAPASTGQLGLFGGT